MEYNSIRIKPYIKSHLELQREITNRIGPLPLLFCSMYLSCIYEHVCNTRFDENQEMTIQDIKEPKRYGRTHAHTHTDVKTVYSFQV